MADELDPILEARLRGALHSEADAVPFTLRADTVRKVGAERARARRAQRFTWFAAAAAVIALAVGSVALTLALRAPGNVAASPAASAAGTVSPTLDATGLLPMSALNSALVTNGVAPLVGLGSDTASSSVTSEQDGIGPLPASDQVVVALSCTGGSVDVRVVAAGSVVSHANETCDTSMIIAWLSGTKIANGGEAVIQVAPQAGVRYRLAAGVRANSTPDPSALPAWNALHAYIGTDTVIAAQGGSSSDSTFDEFLGSLGGRTNLRFVGACTGKITLAWAPAAGEPATAIIGDFPCDRAPHIMALRPEASAPASLQLLVRGDPGSSWMGIVVDAAPATPEPSATSSASPAAAPSLAPLGKGETGLAAADLGADSGTSTWSGPLPAGTDFYRVETTCSGDGAIDFTIDGVHDQWTCAASNTSEYTLGPGDTTTFQATVTGNARFKVRLAAVDLAKAGVVFLPPALSLTGPDYTAGDTVTVTGFPGCGLAWQPKRGSGVAESCGPSWQPVASPLRQRLGTSVTISLPTGWTIDDVTMAYAANSAILPGRDPATQQEAVYHNGGVWTLTVPPAGDWGVQLMVSASHNGDRMQVPYYARVIVEP